MKIKPMRGALAAVIAIAAPVLLATPGVAEAKKPGTRPVCIVGKAGYPTIQSAVDDLNCDSINVPGGTFYENVIIRRDLTIRGAGADRTTVHGNYAGPVFRINGPATQPCAEPKVSVTLEGMTITGGTGPGPCDPPCPRNGGGIAASPGADMTVRNCVVTGNSAHWNGGGISFVQGKLTVRDSEISNNTAYANNVPPATGAAGGGGIRGTGCPNVIDLRNSVVRNNISYWRGGGVFSFTPLTYVIPGDPQPRPTPAGTLIVKDTIISGNTATATNGGGGIYHDHTTLTVSDSDISGNVPNDIQAGPNP